MKMNVTGIVAEYNPFHNGHAYQIREARKLTDCDYCVAVISGDFVQRGEVSVFSKYLRTKMALFKRCRSGAGDSVYFSQSAAPRILPRFSSSS